jgi:hypothetical protein
MPSLSLSTVTYPSTYRQTRLSHTCCFYESESWSVFLREKKLTEGNELQLLL